MKFHYMAHDNQSKSMKKLWPGKPSSFNWKRKMEETTWSSDFYSDIFSLDFDSLFNTIDLESLASKENSDTVPEVLNTTNWERERASCPGGNNKQLTGTRRVQVSTYFHWPNTRNN